ncbi:MAG: aromatic ring-hydroxylating oxygenase subunit alpha [Pikeienuella sp.]
MTTNHPFGGHGDTRLNVILSELNEAATMPFDAATPIPAAVNHSPAFAHLEAEKIFKQEWICVGRADEIPNPGDFLTHTIADVPTLIVRQPDDSIRAFVNACAHRFACLAPDASGSTKRFTCRYHAWTYGLDGNLLRAPYMEMKKGFDPSAHGLRALQAEVWEGFIYVSLADKPKHKVAEALAPLTRNIVGRYGMESYKTVMRETMVWDANWKNLIENFTESYHVPMAHKKTFAKHKKPLSDYVCGPDYDHFGYHHAVQQSDTGGGAAHPYNNRLSGDWRRTMVDFCVFPCHLVTLMPDYLWYISVQPEGTGRFRATWGVAIPPEVLADIPAAEFDQWLSGMRDYMNIANEEDKVLVEALFQGTKSTILPKGTYHPIERNLWQFTRYLNRLCS